MIIDDSHHSTVKKKSKSHISLVIMNSTIELVLKHCSTQLEIYQRCVENNPAEWSTICQKEKYDLTKCSEDK